MTLDHDHTLLSGWGRTPVSGARVAEPATPDEVACLLAEPGGRGAIARGMGRSYGDAAQNAGGLVLSTAKMARIHAMDLDAGTIRVDAGVSLDALLRTLVPLGWWVPVTPGTRFVSVGGAIAADIHGKNHHRDGGFCDYVESLELATPLGARTVDAGSPEFAATAGGMGLTGVVTTATIRLEPIETSRMRVDVERASDVDEAMAMMAGRDHAYHYSVAWIDCLASGKRLGRSVLTRAQHATPEDLPRRARSDPLHYAPAVRLRAPAWFPPGALNPLTVAAFNEAWFRKAPRRRTDVIQSIASYFHPLDGVRDWNRLYGPGGFLQYQFLVPPSSGDVVRTVLERVSAARCASFLAILKRFGPGRGLLSFPVDGWTLTLDVPARTRGLGPLLDVCDDLVAAAGGRVYFAKDSRLRPELVPVMYPELARWREIRDKLDPERVLVSDLARRLNLVEGCP